MKILSEVMLILLLPPSTTALVAAQDRDESQDVP